MKLLGFIFLGVTVALTAASPILNDEVLIQLLSTEEAILAARHILEASQQSDEYVPPLLSRPSTYYPNLIGHGNVEEARIA